VEQNVFEEAWPGFAVPAGAGSVEHVGSEPDEWFVTGQVVDHCLMVFVGVLRVVGAVPTWVCC
jgi:hypothetical protein